MAWPVCLASLGAGLHIIATPLCMCHMQQITNYSSYRWEFITLGTSFQLRQSAHSIMHTQGFRWSNPSTDRHLQHAAAVAAELTRHPLSLRLALSLPPFLPIMLACHWLPAESARHSVTRFAASRRPRFARLQSVRPRGYAATQAARNPAHPHHQI